MVLAIRKDTSGTVPGGGFHYMLHPIPMLNGLEANIFEMMGYIIVKVPDPDGHRYIEEARKALNHQIEIAVLAEKKI